MEDSKILNLNSQCIRIAADKDLYIPEFTCGDADLDDFFSHDAWLYSEQLLGKTYYFITTEDTPQVVAAFTMANDSIKAALVSKTLRNKIQRNIPNSKRTRSYPAVLIARLGVSSKFKGLHIGGQVINYIKSWYTQNDNKSGCRFLVVDAYNKPDVLHFYQQNGFKLLYASEDEERETFSIDKSSKLHSRMMYFDLISTFNS
jgi:GNAT superfamily N-acetyltransferase